MLDQMTWKICTQRCMQRFDRILNQMQKQTATKRRSQSSSTRRSIQQHKDATTFSTKFFPGGQKQLHQSKEKTFQLDFFRNLASLEVKRTQVWFFVLTAVLPQF